MPSSSPSRRRDRPRRRTRSRSRSQSRPRSPDPAVAVSASSGERGRPRRRSRSRSPPVRPPSSPRKREKMRSSSPPSSRRRRRTRSPPRGGGDRESPEPGKVLGIFGLNYRTKERDLEKEFSRFGEVEQVQLVRDPEGESRGFAFINFAHMEDAREAREVMCDQVLDGKRIRVDYSLSRGPHRRTPGQYMGARGRFDRYADRRPPRRSERSPSPKRRSPSPRRRRGSYSPKRY